MSAAAKRLLAAWAFVAMLAGIHELLALALVEGRIAGLLLSAGAAAHPGEALVALAFLVLRVTLLPLAGGLVALTVFHAVRAAVRRAVQGRREGVPSVAGAPQSPL